MRVKCLPAIAATGGAFTSMEEENSTVKTTSVAPRILSRTPEELCELQNKIWKLDTLVYVNWDRANVNWKHAKHVVGVYTRGELRGWIFFLRTFF